VSRDWKDWEGQLVDGAFCLHRFLGGGERSAVFLTLYGDSEPRNASIKLVWADPENAELELSRWRRAAQLSHPHLVRLFQAGICEADGAGLLYAVMEYGEENLADVLRSRPLTEVEAREMLGSTLGALAYIHREGFVHGRMKAANIIAVGDQVKISSDGICKAGALEGGRRPPSVYDPPEFEIEGTSAAGDVWSLGMMLVEALTQQLPGPGGPKQELVSPETLPALFLGIVHDCLQADPRRRAKVSDIAARLRQTSCAAQEHGALAPHHVSRRWRYAVPAATTAGLALAAILAGPALLHRATPPTAAEQPKAQAEAAQKAGAPENGQSTESTGSEKRAADRNASPAPHRSEPAPNVKSSATLGKVVNQVLPKVPRQARDTIRGTVRISVRADVDLSGDVASATLDSRGPSSYFAALALEAARRWKFQPPRIGGRDVPSEWILRFELTRTDTIVRPLQVSP
jgi:TonB family protein